MSNRIFTVKEVKIQKAQVATVPSWSIHFPSFSTLYVNIKFIIHMIAYSIGVCEGLKLPITLLCYSRTITGDLYAVSKEKRFEILNSTLRGEDFAYAISSTKNFILRASAFNNILVICFISYALHVTIKYYIRELNRTKNL
jgi:hypothetical protein